MGCFFLVKLSRNIPSLGTQLIPETENLISNDYEKKRSIGIE